MANKAFEGGDSRVPHLRVGQRPNSNPGLRAASLPSVYKSLPALFREERQKFVLGSPVLTTPESFCC